MSSSERLCLNEREEEDDLLDRLDPLLLLLLRLFDKYYREMLV